MKAASVAALSIALIISFAAGFFVKGIIQDRQRIKSQAAIKAVGVTIYKDAELAIPLTEIDWGILEPGEEKNYSAYVKNDSNVPIRLSLLTENWIPANASIFITLDWNYDDELIGIAEFVEVTFMLIVDPATFGISNFSFDIIVIGSG